MVLIFKEYTILAPLSVGALCGRATFATVLVSPNQECPGKGHNFMQSVAHFRAIEILEKSVGLLNCSLQVALNSV